MPTLALLMLLATDAGEPAETTEADAADILSKPKAMRAILSLLVCMVKQDEAEWLAKIKEEKEESKIAGVVDLRALKYFQDKVVEQRKLIKIHLADLKTRQLKPWGCGSETINVLWSCAGEEGRYSECLSVPVQAMLDVGRALKEAAIQKFYAEIK